MKGLLAALTGIALAGASTHALAEAGTIGDPAERWEKLWSTVLWDLWIMGIIFGALAVHWLIKYKAKGENEVGDGPKLSRVQVWSWALVPAFIFMADDFYLAAKGWSVWNTYRNVPENAMEVKVTGSMWSWEFEYDNGITTSYYVDSKEGDGLVVPVGTPVVLRMTSLDVVHSFGLTKYRVKEDLMPGRVTYIWFNPKEEAESWVTCVEFCGVLHSRMFAPVKAIPQTQFDAWLEKKVKEENS